MEDKASRLKLHSGTRIFLLKEKVLLVHLIVRSSFFVQGTSFNLAQSQSKSQTIPQEFDGAVIEGRKWQWKDWKDLYAYEIQKC